MNSKLTLNANLDLIKVSTRWYMAKKDDIVLSLIKMLSFAEMLIFLIINQNKLDEFKKIIRFGYFFQEYILGIGESVSKNIDNVFMEFYDAGVFLKWQVILVILVIYYAMLIQFNPYSSIYLNN